MSNIKNIEELHELINPEFLTTEESCIDMINKASKNEKIIKNYIHMVHDKINKLTLDKINRSKN